MSQTTDVEHNQPSLPLESLQGASSPLESIRTSLITFQVEGHIVQLPVAPFSKHSTVFRDMFSAPTSNPGETQGGSDNDPILLQDSFKDIKALANYFNPELVEVTRDKDYFLSLLRLADKYDMKQVLNRAATELHDHKIGVFEMLQLAAKFQLPLEWAKAAFHQLIERQDPLSVKEADLINPRWAFAIALVREKRLAEGRGWTQPAGKATPSPHATPYTGFTGLLTSHPGSSFNYPVFGSPSFTSGFGGPVFGSPQQGFITFADNGPKQNSPEGNFKAILEALDSCQEPEDVTFTVADVLKP